tara:strand:- start:76 stop:489 length:414 start_codon:yes stop_codon:yes gene_type:complete
VLEVISDLGRTSNEGYSVIETYVLNNSSSIIFEKPVEELRSAKREKSDVPQSFALLQNFPNPFNPTTTIEFSVETKSNTTLQIHDIKGRLVATLVSGKLVPGFHSVVWDASNFASGIYFVKLKTGSYQATQRIVLLK